MQGACEAVTRVHQERMIWLMITVFSIDLRLLSGCSLKIWAWGGDGVKALGGTQIVTQCNY